MLFLAGCGAAPPGEPDAPPACKQVGQAWVSPVDGMRLVCVPAGNFTMGSKDGSDDENPEHKVHLRAYWIDQTEVTQAQYDLCVAARACLAATESSDTILTSDSRNAADDHYPVNFVDWEQAAAYCAWAGRSLPSEAQWEKAARGTDGRIYPWGNDPPDCTLANYRPDGLLPCLGQAARVGSYPAGASPYGAVDMAGNLFEWVADEYAPYPGGETENFIPPGTGEGRVLRGGCWKNQDFHIRAPNRYWMDESRGFVDVGFRCALWP